MTLTQPEYFFAPENQHSSISLMAALHWMNIHIIGRIFHV